MSGEWLSHPDPVAAYRGSHIVSGKNKNLTSLSMAMKTALALDEGSALPPLESSLNYKKNFFLPEFDA